MAVDTKVFLLPGEFSFSRKPGQISTLLGSCISIIIYDTKNKWAGMNHFMLPEYRDGGMAPGKFGDSATESLLKAAKAAGSKPEDWVASVYGGGVC